MAKQTKPDWVSAELWQWWEAREFSDVEGVPSLDAPEYIWPRDATRRAITDPSCATAWRAIDRQLAKLPDNPETQARLCAALNVLDGIQWAYDGPPDMLPHEERRKHGRRIANAARRLAACLADAPYIPRQIEWNVDEAIRQSLRMFPSTAHVSVHAPITHVLAAIQQGAEAWSFTRPPVDAKSSDPQRLWFVREMSRRMRTAFNTPLHEHVATLANCLYPTADGKELDGPTVAKLTANLESNQRFSLD